MPYKILDNEKLPLHVKRQIFALCGDFKRRQKELERAKRRPEVLCEYRRLNELILDAVSEACPYDSDEVKMKMIEALGEIRGYKWSPLCTVMSAAAFYRRKQLIIYAIAKRMDMI